MNVSILSQGITTETNKSVGTTLIKLLSDDEFHSFTGISAFASVSGVAILAPYIEAAKLRAVKLRLIVGVDQQATSKEALEAIMSLGIEAYVFYQTSYSIFHPKIYLFESNESAQLIVGSSNLTQQGLFISVEGSAHLQLTLSEASDTQVLADLKAQFASLYDLTDPNLQPITQDLIDKLVTEQVIPTEVERKEARANAKEKATEEEEEEPAIEREIPKIFPKRALPKVPAEYRLKKKSAAAPAAAVAATAPSAASTLAPAASAVPTTYTTRWMRTNVPGASVQTTSSAETNPTGMMRLVQADYVAAGQLIDPATYFRQVVFDKLTWAPITAKTDIAIGFFEVVIHGKALGTYPLRIRHKPSGVAGQGNYTTGVSWGTLGNDIRDANLAGTTVRLSQKDGTDDTFRLEFF